MAHTCCGDCGGCHGCRQSVLELTEGEVALLRALGQIPFLPVARKADAMTPYYLEDTAFSVAEYSAILESLAWKGLITLDFDKPLSGFDAGAYREFPICGSMALTARGQRVLEQLELQGAC